MLGGRSGERATSTVWPHSPKRVADATAQVTSAGGSGNVPKASNVAVRPAAMVIREASASARRVPSGSLMLTVTMYEAAVSVLLTILN